MKENKITAITKEKEEVLKDVYKDTLEILDAYDHQTLTRPEGTYYDGNETIEEVAVSMLYDMIKNPVWYDCDKQIAAIMDNLRKNPPKAFGDLAVVSMRDYESGKVVNLETGKESKTELPKSNVLYFDLTNDSWCCARPSGTEPKIKFYMGVKGSSLKDAEEKNAKLTECLKEKAAL